MKSLNDEYTGCHTIEDIENHLLQTAQIAAQDKLSALELEWQDLALLSREANQQGITDTIEYKLRSSRMDSIEAEISQLLSIV